MSAQNSPKTSLRGRIIRRVEPAGCGRRVGEDSLKAHGSGPLKTSPLSLTSAGGTLCSFVITPFVFIVSAAFMISQPLSDGSSAATSAVSTTQSHHSRFRELGAEYRRLTRVHGVPIAQPRTKVELPTSIVHQPIQQESKPQERAPSKKDLEEQVLKILQRYGRPVQKSEVLARAIVTEALAQNYDPLFVAAVIKSESAFNSLARSHKGAQGLMQIMPKTGAWLADQVSLPRGKLTDPGHNLKLGITYLKQLEAEYGGNRVLTLVAYNWGPGHVESASKGRRRVPGQVMQYAVKILNDYRAWRSDVG